MKMDNLQEIILKNSLKISFTLIIFLSFLYVLSPFIIPVTLGGILAMAFSPYIRFFMNQGLSRKAALRMLTLTFFILGIIPSVFVVMRGSQIMTEMMNDEKSLFNLDVLKVKLTMIIQYLSTNYGLPQETLIAQLDKVTKNLSSFLFNLFGNLVSEIPDIALIALMTVFSLYYFLAQEDKIRKIFDQYFFFSEKNGEEFIRVLKSSCREVFFSNVMTGIIQAMVVSIGSLIAGVGDFFLIFFITFIFSFIPILGAGPVALLLSLYSFMTSDFIAGGILLIVTLIAGVSDNLIRPFLASLGDVEVPGFIGFMAVLGGVIVFGLPGLFLAPLSASLTFGLIPILFKEYQRP